MTEKKKRLTIAERATIVERLLQGECASHLAIEYGVSQPAISHIKKNKENILANKRNLDEQQGNMSKKKCTGVEESTLDMGLYKWYLQKRSLGHIVSGPMLKEKALSFSEMLDSRSDFKASNGWLNRFKKRHTICEFTMQNGKSNEEPSSVEFSKDFAQFVMTNNMNPDYIYNADETSLLWKSIPNETIIEELKKEKNFDPTKERITIMVCSNASGTHKIPLLVIGKSKKPRCFDNIAMLPVIYKSEKNAWMNKDLFAEWYREIFLPAVEQKHGAEAKCILLIDNSPAHPPAEILNSISLVCTINCLPPTVSCNVQPSQDIIVNLKKIYKKNLLRNVIMCNDVNEILSLLTKWNIVDCFNAISHAWESMSEASLRRPWRSILLIPDDPWYTDNELLEPHMLFDLLKKLPNGDRATIEETIKWLDDEHDDPGWKVLTDREILYGPEEQKEETDIADEQENDLRECPIQPEEALSGIEKFEKWYQSRPECSPEDLLLLQHFRNLAVSKVLLKKSTSGGSPKI